MRSIAQRLLVAALAVSVILLWAAHSARSLDAAPQRSPVVMTRIYTGADGHTHVQQMDVKLSFNPALSREQSDKTKVVSSYVGRFPAGYAQGLHPAPVRRYVITLSGRGEVELEDGEKLLLEPGGVLQADDVTGKGHMTRTLGKTDWTVLFVEFEQ